MKTAYKTFAAIFALLAIALFAACSSDSDDGFISDGYLANGITWTAYTDDNEDDPAYTLVFFIQQDS